MNIVIHFLFIPVIIMLIYVVYAAWFRDLAEKQWQMDTTYHLCPMIYNPSKKPLKQWLQLVWYW